MAAPLAVGVIAGSLALGAVSLHLVTSFEGAQRAASVADNAALAAADRMFGWASGDPCGAATLIAAHSQAEVRGCELAHDSVVVTVHVDTLLGGVTRGAKAGVDTALLGE